MGDWFSAQKVELFIVLIRFASIAEIAYGK
jgi:hypothetical protein